MGKRIQEWFVFLTGIILFVAGVTILWSSAKPTRFLDIPDPILFLSGRRIFYLTGGIELALSAFLLLANPRHATIKLLLIAWLATGLFVYHEQLLSIRGPDLFGCLGNITDQLPIPPKILDSIMLILFNSLLVGAYLLLAFDWFARYWVGRVSHSRKQETSVVKT